MSSAGHQGVSGLAQTAARRLPGARRGHEAAVSDEGWLDCCVLFGSVLKLLSSLSVFGPGSSPSSTVSSPKRTTCPAPQVGQEQLPSGSEVVLVQLQAGSGSASLRLHFIKIITNFIDH